MGDSGSDNGVLYGQGLDLSGNSPVENQLATDGFIYIGSSTNNPEAALPTSTDNALLIVGGDGSLDLKFGPALKGTSGYVLTGNGTSNDPTFQPGGFSITWTEVTGTSKTMEINNGYISNNSNLVTLTLPTIASIGNTLTIVGKGSGLWKIAQNANQYIILGNQSTTTGIGGSIDATNDKDCVEIVCTEQNNEFTIYSSIGNLTVI